MCCRVTEGTSSAADSSGITREVAEQEYDTPSAANLDLSVTKKSEDCYDALEFCSVSYEVDISPAAGVTFSPWHSYELTYRVEGARGSELDTVRIRGDYVGSTRGYATTDRYATLTASVVSVED